MTPEQRIEDLEFELDMLKTEGTGPAIAAQAYQCLGRFLLPEENQPVSEGELLRALDYFGAGEYDPDFLPWPRRGVEQ